MDRSGAGYYQDTHLQYPTSANQVYIVQGPGNAVPRASPAGTTMEYTRTGQAAPEGHRRIEYYVQDHPAGAAVRPSAGEYYTHGPPVAAQTALRPVQALTYYSQEPQTIAGGGAKSCGCASKAQYFYTQPPIARDATPVPQSAVTRQILPPPASNEPPTTYYYVQEPAPTQSPAVPPPANSYPAPRPYPDSSGQKIISYERYVVPASSSFTYDPTSPGPQDHYRVPLVPGGAQQPSSYRYDGDQYPGHVTGGIQQIPQEVAERLGAMRIGGRGGGVSDVIYVPRSSSNDVVYKDPRMWRPRK